MLMKNTLCFIMGYWIVMETLLRYFFIIDEFRKLAKIR